MILGVARRPRLAASVLVVALVTGLLGTWMVSRAAGDSTSTCERRAATSAQRAASPVGSGRPVVVIGDSYSVGSGLDDLDQAFPRDLARLPGRVYVAGFSGSGFSRDASPCDGDSYAERAPGALALAEGRPALVVVEGGLNDVGHTEAEIRDGFARLRLALLRVDPRRVLVVGPASAPKRIDGVPAVDALLHELSDQAGYAYLRTADLDLPYLPDGVHLTEPGHREFGGAVLAEARAVLAAARLPLPVAQGVSTPAR